MRSFDFIRQEAAEPRKVSGYIWKVPSREENLARALVGLADNLVNHFDVVDLFYELVEATTELLSADQSGLLLAASPGNLRVMAVTSESEEIVELLKKQHPGGGPSVEAYLTGELVQDVFGSSATSRWPGFAEHAREIGFGYVAAVPMRLRDEIIGSLNIFRFEANTLTEIELMAARALADIATIAIIQERVAKEKEVLVGQLERALGSRTAIEQAKGIIATATGLSLEKAFERLRTYSRSNNQRLREVAHRVAAGDLDPRILRDG